MKEYILDGETYYFNGKRWLDARGLVVPSGLLGKLNSILLKDVDLFSKSDDELLNYAASVKEGENYSLAIKAMEILVDRADASIVKSVLPRLTSCYRKMGRTQDAINLAEEHLEKYGTYMKSPALFTSLGAAYCDVEDYSKARECANRAYAMSGRYASGELHALYGRINKFDEAHTTQTEKKEIKEAIEENSRKTNETIVRIQEPKVVQFSESLEREAINRIWRAIPFTDREDFCEDFEIICNSLKSGKLTSKE